MNAIMRILFLGARDSRRRCFFECRRRSVGRCRGRGWCYRSIIELRNVHDRHSSRIGHQGGTNFYACVPFPRLSHLVTKVGCCGLQRRAGSRSKINRAARRGAPNTTTFDRGRKIALVKNRRTFSTGGLPYLLTEDLSPCWILDSLKKHALSRVLTIRDSQNERKSLVCKASTIFGET